MEKVDSVCSVTSVCSVQSLDDSFDVVPEETKFQLNVDGEKVRYKLKKDKSLPYSTTLPGGIRIVGLRFFFYVDLLKASSSYSQDVYSQNLVDFVDRTRMAGGSLKKLVR